MKLAASSRCRAQRTIEAVTAAFPSFEATFPARAIPATWATHGLPPAGESSIVTCVLARARNEARVFSVAKT